MKVRTEQMSNDQLAELLIKYGTAEIIVTKSTKTCEVFFHEGYIEYEENDLPCAYEHAAIVYLFLFVVLLLNDMVKVIVTITNIIINIIINNVIITIIDEELDNLIVNYLMKIKVVYMKVEINYLMKMIIKVEL